LKTRKDVFVAIITNLVLLLGTHTTEAGQDSPPLSSAQIVEILSSPDRTAADRTNDLRRKPEQMLGFIGIRPGIIALDLSAASGYTTELLARSIGPTGKVYGQSRPRDLQPSADILLRAGGQQPPKSRAGRDPGGATGRTAAISGRTSRSRR
jgi:predicted methyltransferase